MVESALFWGVTIMVRLWMLAGATLVTVASPVAAGPFDGTWKDDVASVQPSNKPNVRAIVGGVFTCSTCIPPIKIPADGAFHPVTGNPYFDAYSATVVNATTVKTAARKAGKVIGEQTSTLADGGKTLTTSFTDRSASNGVAVTGTTVEARVAAGPAGSHATSGSWVGTNKNKVSDNGTTYTFTSTGDTVSLKLATGAAYTAKIDGPQAPVTGDPGWTAVTLKRGGPNTLIETDYRDGKPLSRLTMTVSADGKSLRTVVVDLRRDRTTIITATKQ